MTLFAFVLGVALVIVPSYALRPPPSRVAALLRGSSAEATSPRGRRLIQLGSALASRPLLGSVRGARRRRREANRVLDDLPDVVDLLALAVGGGLGLRLALEAVCRSGDGPVVEALRGVLGRVERGGRLADQLDRAGPGLGDAARPLVAAMVANERYGVALLPALERISTELRHARRRRGEEAARRCSVRLVFPLVACTLPAFVLLTVVPLIAGSIGALRW